MWVKKKKKRTKPEENKTIPKTLSNLSGQKYIVEVGLSTTTIPPQPTFYIVMIICSAEEACGNIRNSVTFSFSESDPAFTGAFSGSSFCVNECWCHPPPGTISPPLPWKCYAVQRTPGQHMAFPPSVLSQLCEQPQVACNCPNAHFTTILQLIAA